MIRARYLPVLAVLAACGGSIGNDPADPAPASSSGTAVGGDPEDKHWVSSGSSGATSSGGTTTPTNVCVGVASTPSCDAPLDVATAADVFAEIAKVNESVQASTQKDGGEKLRPTRDLHATTTIELDVAVFNAAHPSCDPSASTGATGKGCSEAVFANELTADYWRTNVPTGSDRLPPGVTCADSAPTEGCTKLTIAEGTTVRFARSTQPIYFGQMFPHMINVTRACTAACATDELRCGASTTCIAGASFCLLCEAKPLEVCACRDVCASKADNAPCGYDTSDDTGESGTCIGGMCSTK